MADQKSSSVLMAPLRGAASVLRKVPGAEAVGRAAEETVDKVGAVTGEALSKVEAVTDEALDRIGAVSPRGRRIAAYAGAGVLGAARVVEWPVALTGAAVAWLTQSRPGHANGEQRAEGKDTGDANEEPAHDLGTAALRSGSHPGSGEAHEPPGPVRTSHTKGSSGRLGPTARPEHTNL